MAIDFYDFGHIVVDGRAYDYDIIIFEGTVLRWTRRQSHLLEIEDLREALRESPDIVLIGNGYNGLMKVPDQVIYAIGAQGIEVIVEKTTEVVRRFNELPKSRRAIAALHITC